MKFLILLVSFVSIQAQARELCFPQSSPDQYICFSPGEFELDTTEIVTIEKNGEVVQEFEATVVKINESESWDGGRTCIRDDYPMRDITLVSTEISSTLQWSLRQSCKFISRGRITPVRPKPYTDPCNNAHPPGPPRCRKI